MPTSQNLALAQQIRKWADHIRTWYSRPNDGLFGSMERVATDLEQPEEPVKLSSTMKWFSYECSHVGCPRGPTGLIVEIRHETEPPEVRCPLCGQPMELDSWWQATESGHGASDDHDHDQFTIPRTTVER